MKQSPNRQHKLFSLKSVQRLAPPSPTSVWFSFFSLAFFELQSICAEPSQEPLSHLITYNQFNMTTDSTSAVADPQERQISYRRYELVAAETKQRLLDMVFEGSISVYLAAKVLNLNYSTAKAIAKKYKKNMIKEKNRAKREQRRAENKVVVKQEEKEENEVEKQEKRQEEQARVGTLERNQRERRAGGMVNQGRAVGMESSDGYWNYIPYHIPTPIPFPGLYWLPFPYQ